MENSVSGVERVSLSTPPVNDLVICRLIHLVSLGVVTHGPAPVVSTLKETVP